MNNSDTFYTTLKPYLRTKDYFLSQEDFELKINEEYQLLVTQPVPKNLEFYYESEAYISHSNQPKGVFDRIYGFVKSIALKRKLELINSFSFHKKLVLDIGAGTGDFLLTCKKRGWNTFGTEPNLKARDVAKQKGIYLEADLSKFKKQQFEVITLWHVLEHVPNLSELISELNSLLAENGRIIVAVPNFNSFDASYYGSFWAAFDVPRHLWHFSRSAIHKIFSKEKIRVEKILPMKFDSFYVSLLSEKYKTGKMNPIKAFFIGLRSNFKAIGTGEYSSLIYVLKKDK